jgi:outer membrane lipoprotein carrier protein
MRVMRISLLISGVATMLLAQATYAQGIEAFRAFLADTTSVRGVFTQTDAGRSGHKTRQSSGSFALVRPNKFRWSYEKPDKQLLIADGQKLWSYDPDLNQVTVRKLDNALGASPAALLAGNALEKNFTLTDAGSADGMQFIVAVPASKDATFQSVRIGMKNKLPRVMEVRDNFGQTIFVHFDQIEANVVLPADTFRFTPPNGADVLGE